MFCSKCGKEINDEAVICPNCGCFTSNYKELQPPVQSASVIQIVPKALDVKSTLNTAKTLGIIGIIAGLFIPLAGWICGGVGIGKCDSIINNEPNNQDALSTKNINIGAIVVASIAFVINFIFIIMALD